MFIIEVFSKTEKKCNALLQRIFLNWCVCTQLPAVAQSVVPEKTSYYKIQLEAVKTLLCQ